MSILGAEQKQNDHSHVDSDQLQGKKNRDRLNSEKERFGFGSESKTKSWNKSMEATSRGLVGLLVPAKGEQIHARDGGASAVVAAAAS